MVVDNLFEGTISVLRNEIICIGFTVYADNDDDGYGDISNSIFAVDCITPDDYVSDSTDSMMQMLKLIPVLAMR